jgi:SPP1 family predicted phage head-tail adaptor
MKWAPGELHQRITIMRDTHASDGCGGSLVTPVAFATLWAKAIPMSGRERSEQGRLAAVGAYVFVIRWRTDLLASDYVLWQGVRFNIRSLPSGGGRTMYLEIDAERGTA